MTSRTDIQRGLLRISAALTLLMAVFAVCRGERADTVHVDIHYPVAGWKYKPTFRDNAGVADSIRKALNKGVTLGVEIISSASPEGNPKFNQLLSERRTATALKLLSSLPEMDMDSIYQQSQGAVWTGLTKEMTDVTRHRRLRHLHGGATWRHLRDSVFPDLRVSRISIITLPPLPVIDADMCSYYGTPAPLPEGAPTVAEPYMHWNLANRTICDRTSAVALRSNLLYDLAAIPNIGVEYTSASGWAAGLTGLSAWWGGKKRARYWRLQGFELTLRHYFGRCPFSGWHVGLYGQMVRYDFRLNGTGYLSGASGATFFQRPTVGGGIEGGYSLRLSDTFSLDITAGAGYLTGQYQTYTASPGHHSVWQTTRHRRYWGPSKAEVALVWKLWKGGGR